MAPAPVAASCSLRCSARGEGADSDTSELWQGAGAVACKLERASAHPLGGLALAPEVPEPPMRRLLRSGRLRVEPLAGAGLHLVTCQLGYLVEAVDWQPGQPDLRPGDAILAIGSAVLLDLLDDDVERCFGEAFRDGATFIAGPHQELCQQCLENVQQAVRQLLDVEADRPISCDAPKASPLEPGAAIKAACAVGLHPHDADDGVKVQDDCSSASCQHGGQNLWLGVRGRPGILQGAYQYEVQLEDACLLRVGWSSAGSRRALGKDARSFGYGGTAMKSSSGRFEPYGEEFNGSVGAIVSCLIDRRDLQLQTISYCLNGRSLGVAFQLPAEFASVPLFPAVCGRGDWRAGCRWQELSFPVDGYRPLGEALAAGDAVVGPSGSIKPPSGVPVVKNYAIVRAGHKVVLHVLTGAWAGWFVCQVVDVDPLGCYLRHEEDGFTEHLPWSYLSGARYRMELLQEAQPSLAEPAELEAADARLGELKGLLLAVVAQLTEEQVEAIDRLLDPRQQAFVAWMATQDGGGAPDPKPCDGDLATSNVLSEWLAAIGLACCAPSVRDWCLHQGAASLAELLENREELAAALPELAPQERARLFEPLAARAADVTVRRAQAYELEAILRTILPHFTEEQRHDLEGGLSAEEWASVAQLVGQSHAGPGAECLCAGSPGGPPSPYESVQGPASGAAARMSSRDQRLFRCAAGGDGAGAGGSGKDEWCDGCGEACIVGKVCQEDGGLYCPDCWSEWQ
mmetsp:Transcript_105051/g.338742  ORF Transcript_105051/g.338742 Transcript_105051/m.338742 type:complete len:742 (-) Transcript_105051:131-2356(-)